MTLFIVDVSKYQAERPDPLNLPRALQAGFGAVNIALDRGRGDDVLPTWALGYATLARMYGMGICTYRWLDNRMTGAASAQRAYERMVHLGLGSTTGMAHAVDCEDDATEQHLRDYVTTMVSLLKRPIAIYSGRWWLAPRGWRVADLSPYLWSAPSAGYLGAYPGDDSRHWQVTSYGGWSSLTLMQYAVAPLPGTGECSLTAVRDMAAWRALTGGAVVARAANMQALTNDIQRQEPGATVWGKGDLAHQGSSSDHNEDDTPGSKPEQEDADSNPEHRGIDVPILGPITMTKLRKLRAKLVDRPANRARLKYVILEQKIWRRNGGWVEEVYTGEFHNHLHVSGLAANDEDGSPWDIDDAPAPQEAEDMQPVLIMIQGDPVPKIVTMGVGHLPIIDAADLARWKTWMAGNGMVVNVTAWPAAWRPQIGPDLSAQPSVEITPEVAAFIAQQIVAAGSNDLSDADLEEIKALVISGAKQAAREGTE